MAEHVRKFPTTWRNIERRARAYRPQLRRVTVAAQTGLVLVRTRVARLHSHGTDLAVVPSWLCALRALQGHRRHDRPARLRRRRAVPHRLCYRFMIGRSIPTSEVTWLDHRHIKGRLPPRFRSCLPATPSCGTWRETAVTTETPGTPEKRKRSWKFRFWWLETTVSFYRTSPAFPTAPSRPTSTSTTDPSDPHLPSQPLSPSPPSPPSLSKYTAIGDCLAYPSLLLAWVLADRYGDGSRDTRDSVRRSPSIGWTIDQIVATTCDTSDLCLLFLTLRLVYLWVGSGLVAREAAPRANSVMLVVWSEKICCFSSPSFI